MRSTISITILLALSMPVAAQPVADPDSAPPPAPPAPPALPAPPARPAPPAPPVPPVPAAPIAPVQPGVIVVTAPAQPRAPTLAFQIGGGYLSSGTVYIEDVEADENGGAYGSLAIDSIVTPRLSLGLFVVGARTDVEGNDVSVATVGATIKTRFGDPAGSQFRVGIAFGYQRIQADDDEDGDPIVGFDIAPIVELALPASNSLAIVLQASALSQPVGGNADVSVTFAPIGYAGVMLELRN